MDSEWCSSEYLFTADLASSKADSGQKFLYYWCVCVYLCGCVSKVKR